MRRNIYMLPPLLFKSSAYEHLIAQNRLKFHLPSQKIMVISDVPDVALVVRGTLILMGPVVAPIADGGLEGSVGAVTPGVMTSGPRRRDVRRHTQRYRWNLYLPILSN